MLAIQEKNIDVHFTAVERITEEGVVGADGEERKCDTIICATGFDVTYRPRFPIIGRNGVSLNDKWAKVPESYLGLAVSDMPNMVMFIGPSQSLSFLTERPLTTEQHGPSRTAVWQARSSTW